MLSLTRVLARRDDLGTGHARIGGKFSCQFLKFPRLSGGCHRCSALGMRSIMFWLAPPLPCIRQTRKEDLRVIFPLDSYSSSPAVPLDHRRPANSRRLVAWPRFELRSTDYEPVEFRLFYSAFPRYYGFPELSRLYCAFYILIVGLLDGWHSGNRSRSSVSLL